MTTRRSSRPRRLVFALVAGIPRYNRWTRAASRRYRGPRARIARALTYWPAPDETRHRADSTR
jgi:hypothetical protein